MQNHAFQPVKTVLKNASDTIAILLVFVSDDQLTSIVHVHIGLIVQHIGSQIYEPQAFPQFIQSIEADLKHTKEKQEASCMFVAIFGGMMALPTDLPYCLVYPNIYSSTIPEKDRHHFNIGGNPLGVHTCMCICCALLQHADMSADHRQMRSPSAPTTLSLSGLGPHPGNAPTGQDIPSSYCRCVASYSLPGIGPTSLGHQTSTGYR